MTTTAHRLWVLRRRAEKLADQLASTHEEIAEQEARKAALQREAEARRQRAQAERVAAQGEARRRRLEARAQAVEARKAERRERKNERGRAARQAFRRLVPVVAAAAAEHFGRPISSAAILDRGKTSRVAAARKVLVWIAREKLQLTYSEIAKMLGRELCASWDRHRRELGDDAIAIINLALERMASVDRPEVEDSPTQDRTGT